jgi:hypothetical protein
MNDQLKHTQTRVIPVTEWNNHHSWPPQGGLRHLIFNAKNNGFDKVIRRAGRRVLLDERAFFNWLDEQNGGAA